ncbi:HIT family protein [Gymnodinialimonas sp. 2305UL16-5]|uniref:HIT family protein n=1 Tax=Gymnodinialimonas mytili TaxID=3126503 RepID=UPI00309531F9
MADPCIFCSILAGQSPASVVHEDEHCLAFMTLRPIRSGAFLVIPKVHIDHFTDLPDDLAGHLLSVAQRYGRRLLDLTPAKRIGYVVHGFGVPHAHLNVVPQHDTFDIISARYVVVDGGAAYQVTESAVPAPTRIELDQMAAALRAEMQPAG